LGFYLPVSLAEQTANHVARAAAAALGAVFLLGTRRRPAWTAWEGPPAPFSRWAGWLLAYGALAVIRWAVFSATQSELAFQRRPRKESQDASRIAPSGGTAMCLWDDLYELIQY